MSKVKVIADGRRGVYVLRWAEGSRWRQRSTGLSASSRNYSRAVREAAKLENHLSRVAPSEWDELILDYKERRLNALSAAYRKSTLSAIAAYESTMGAPRSCADITPETLERFIAKSGRTSSTLRSYLKFLRAILSWGAENGYLETVPRFPKVKGSPAARSRPITEAEHDLMLAAVDDVRRDDGAVWRDYLTGLWLSGLRLSESIELSYDRLAPLSVDVGRKYPCLRIAGGADKGGRAATLPLAPDFAEWLKSRSPKTGPVFPVGVQPTQAGKIVREVGRASGVVVSSTGKAPSAQDYRRAFGTRWAQVLAPAELMTLMRHRSMDTTLRYYVDLDSDDLARKMLALGGADGWRTASSGARKKP